MSSSGIGVVDATVIALVVKLEGGTMEEADRIATSLDKDSPLPSKAYAELVDRLARVRES